MAENEAVVRVQVGKAGEKRGEDDGDDEVSASNLARAPIFAEMSDKGTIDSIIVERIGPIKEGTLEPRAEPTLSEEDIRERWGGGRFKLTGRTEQGRTVKGAYRTLEIAGAPILQSDLARRRYAQMLGSADGGVGGPPAAQAITMADVAALLSSSTEREERERQRRDDDDKRRRDADDERHRRDLERIAAESAAAAERARVEDERRRADDERREERRRRDDEQRDDRRRKDEEESRRRDREHQQAMAAVNAKPAVDPVAMLIAGVNLAGKLRGDGGGGGPEAPSDPLTALAANLPQTVQELGRMFGNKSAPAAAAPGAGEPLTIAGPLGEKGKRAVEHLVRQGFSAEQALDHVFETLLQARKPTAPPEPAAATAPASTRGAPPPPRRGTTIRPPAPRAAPATAPTAPTAPAPTAPAEPEPVDDAHPGGTAIP